MKVLLSSFLTFLFLASYAQTVLTVDKTEAVIGDQLKATITTNLENGKEWRNINEVWPDSIQGIEIASGPEIDDKNPASVRATWLISVFDTGYVRIPALSVVIREGNNLDTFITNDIPVMVKPLEPDSTGLRPIKEIIKQPFSFSYYIRYWPFALAFLILLAGAYYWWKQKTKPVVVPPVIVPEPLPHEWAYNELDKLEADALWQKEEIKEHYSRLTGILRAYLERRYGINALEQTSDEIIQQLQKQNLSGALLRDTEDLLSLSDMIKFARANAEADIHAKSIERVRNFVKETLFIPVEPSTDKSNTDEPVE